MNVLSCFSFPSIHPMELNRNRREHDDEMEQLISHEERSRDAGGKFASCFPTTFPSDKLG
jgi:hypothetical protein